MNAIDPLHLVSDLVYGEIGTSLSISKLNSGGAFYTGPYLDGTGITNVTTQIGTHAYLPCKVTNDAFEVRMGLGASNLDKKKPSQSFMTFLLTEMAHLQ